jgi:TetR/AcrR family fatty acid metabolism transcriptional regulator
VLLTTMMKESIFEAATSVLSEHGLDGTTMNRVAAAADLAKSSLYDYFPSKHELLDFVSDRLVAPFMQAVEETMQADLPAPQKLVRIVRIGFENSTKHKAIVKLLVQSDQEYRVRRRTRPLVLDAFTAIFEQGIKEGSFHPHNPAHTARMFLGAFREIFELLASSASEEAASEYAEALIGTALHGLSIHVRPGETKA